MTVSTWYLLLGEYLKEIQKTLTHMETKAVLISAVNKSCRRTASSPAGYILYCNILIIKPYNIGHTDLDVFVCKSFCHLDIIIQV